MSDCYKLAKFYGVHPSAFLCEPFSVVEMHMQMTGLMLKELADEGGGDG